MPDTNKKKPQRIREDWPVSTTGGPKVTGKWAAQTLKVSIPQLYVLMDRGELLRAEARMLRFRSQPIVYFLIDVVNLAVKQKTITQQEANELLSNPDNVTNAA